MVGTWDVTAVTTCIKNQNSWHGILMASEALLLTQKYSTFHKYRPTPPQKRRKKIK